MVNSCMVPGCSGRTRKGQKVSFHYLPKDMERCKQWLRVINHPNYSEYTAVENLKTRMKVCSLHFKKEDFELNVLGMKRVALLDTAIPSLFNVTFPDDDEQPGPSGLNVSSAKPIRLEDVDYCESPVYVTDGSSSKYLDSVRTNQDQTLLDKHLSEEDSELGLNLFCYNESDSDQDDKSSEQTTNDVDYCESPVYVTDGSSSKCLDLVSSNPDQTLLDKHLSEEDSELGLNLFCYNESDSDQDDKSSEQTTTESQDIVCNSGEQQQILQTTVKMCSIGVGDCRNMMEIKTETTEEEHNTGDDDEDDDDDDDKQDKRKRDDNDDFFPSDELDDDDDDHCIPSDEINESSDEEKTHKCPYCKKTFSNPWNVTSHVRIHSKEKPYQCRVCGKFFKLLSYLKRHEKIHREEKPFQCLHCDKRFSNKPSLTQHERVHTGEKPYLCQHCGKSFAIHQNFKFHLRVHTREKPYHCSICDKSFARPQTFKIHRQIHTGVKPYPCRFCGKSFTRQDNLATHQRIHTGEKPYKCTQCDLGFTQAVLLRLHQKKHHGGKP